jgi:predicted permease
MPSGREPNLFEVLRQDTRYGLRGVKNNPGFFAIAAFTLALGIGARAAVFSLVNTILLKRLPYPNSNRVLMIWRGGPIAVSSGDDFPWSPPEFSLLSQTATAFENLGAFKKQSFNLTGGGNPELLEGVRASAGFFPALGTPAYLGRTFSPDDDRPGHEYVVVLSNRLWRSRFGGDANILGKAIDLNGAAYTVIGVMPMNFSFPNTEGMPALLDVPKQTQLWTPLAFPAAPRGANELGVIGVLKPGISLSQAQENLDLFQQRLVEQVPQEKGWFSRIVPLAHQTISDARRPLLLLLAAVSVVLFIACSNVAGLMVNRSLARRRELTLRSALGASRGRLVRQLMTENLLLALGSGMTGIVLGETILLLVKHFGPRSIPHLRETALDWHVLGYAVAITLTSGVLFGLIPAIGATRMNMAMALRESAQRSGGSASAPTIRKVLLVTQLALAVVLVIAAGLLVRTFHHMVRSNPGFEAMHVITFELPLPGLKYSDTNRMAQLYQRVLLQLENIPGVQAAGFASVVPMGGEPDSTVIRMPQHNVDTAVKPYANYSFISPGYFAAISAPLLRGRDVVDSDTLQTMPVTIINNSMAKKYFPGENPIGKQVGVDLRRIPLRTIIGLVADIKHGSLRETPAPEMFVPYTQNEIKVWPSMQTVQYALRTPADPALVAEGIRRAVHSIDPDLPIAKLAALRTLVNDSMTADRLSMQLVASFGILALILVSIGMYGVMSYSVIQRTTEIGVRMAVGAQRAQILLMIALQAARLAAVGIMIGLVAALITTRLMGRFLYHVGSDDPLTFVLVTLLLVAIALLSCYIPARRAMKLDPIVALRSE